MGGVDCHAYYEFEGKNVNAAKLKAAWDTVLAAHPMLHTRFTADGKQQTMPAVYPNTFSMLDLSAFAEDMQEEKLLEVRHALSHRRFDLEFGETAGIKHCICSGGRSVTCIDFALIVCDVQSIKIVLRDLAACYAAGKTPEVDHNWNFGAYMEDAAKRTCRRKSTGSRVLENTPPYTAASSRLAASGKTRKHFISKVYTSYRYTFGRTVDDA